MGWIDDCICSQNSKWAKLNQIRMMKKYFSPCPLNTLFHPTQANSISTFPVLKLPICPADTSNSLQKLAIKLPSSLLFETQGTKWRLSGPANSSSFRKWCWSCSLLGLFCSWKFKGNFKVVGHSSDITARFQLNRVTPEHEKLYLIVKVVVRLTDPSPIG